MVPKVLECIAGSARKELFELLSLSKVKKPQ